MIDDELHYNNYILAQKKDKTTFADVDNRLYGMWREAILEANGYRFKRQFGDKY